MRKLRVLDLFAGCGGLSKGFELTGGFEIVAANEIWEPAQKTYERNHPEVLLVKGDITEESIKRKLLESFAGTKCDVIVGGPPCQAYSHAGARDPDDPRGKLFEDYVALVDRLRPTVFVMENVKGILTMEHERDELNATEQRILDEITDLETKRRELLLLRKRSKNNPERFPFGPTDEKRLELIKGQLGKKKRSGSIAREKVTDIILRRFRDIGYRVEFRLLNAANYGVPQKRERVIFIGVRDTREIRFPEPTHISDARERDLFAKPWATVRDAISDLRAVRDDVEWNHIRTVHSPEFIDKIQRTPVGKSVFGGYSDSFYKNPPDEPSRTVKENHGGVLVHYEEDRVMTPRELARLQSFGDDFIFEGSKSQILVQIGNAVPPLLGRAIGGAIKEMLSDNGTLEPRSGQRLRARDDGSVELLESRI